MVGGVVDLVQDGDGVVARDGLAVEAREGVSGEFGDVKGAGEAVGADVGQEEGKGGRVVGVDDGGAGGGGNVLVVVLAVVLAGVIKTWGIVAALEEGIEGAEGVVCCAAGNGDDGRGGGTEEMLEAGDLLDEVIGDGEGAAGEMEFDVVGFPELVITAKTWFGRRSFALDQM